jgi:hypothetical protein
LVLSLSSTDHFKFAKEDDGIQEIISVLITPTTTDDNLHRILTILWYIWKVRNDARFRNKK